MDARGKFVSGGQGREAGRIRDVDREYEERMEEYAKREGGA